MRSGDRHARLSLWLTILAVAFVAMIPALAFHQLDRGDARFHLRWQLGYAPLFWEGYLAPRWLPAMNMGLGSPAFFFYPPMAQWAASLFAPLLPGPQGVPLRLALSSTLALALGGGGVAAWLLARTGNRAAALCGALLFMLLPYHLYVDTYHRGALAELWALAVSPWAFFGIERLARETSVSGILAASLGIAGLFLSHAPSALTTVPLILGYGLLLVLVRRIPRRILPILASAAIGVALAAFYLATALTETRFINTAALFDGKMQPIHWLLGRGRWPDTSLTPVVLLLNGVHLVVGAACAILVWKRTASIEARAIVVALVAMLVVTAALQTAVAAPLWALKTPLARIQFPWRLLTVQTLLASFAAGLAYHETRRAPRLRLLFGAAILGTVLLDIALLGYRITREHGRGQAVTHAAVLLGETRDAPEYQLGEVAPLARRFGSNAALIVSGTGTLRIESQRPRRIVVRTDSAGPITLAVRQFRYTGWQARIDEGPRLPASASGPVPMIDVPAGSHRVTVSLVPLPAERWGALVSLGGALCLALWLAALMVGRRRGGHPIG